MEVDTHRVPRTPMLHRAGDSFRDQSRFAGVSPEAHFSARLWLVPQRDISGGRMCRGGSRIRWPVPYPSRAPGLKRPRTASTSTNVAEPGPISLPRRCGGARVLGRCEIKTGLAPFHRWVALVMSQELYRSASRVFWIMDKGSGHRGQKVVHRLRRQWPTLVPVHTPVHASGLNQVEIYFSIVPRTVLGPRDFTSRAVPEARVLRLQDRHQQIATPFQWTFTGRGWATLLIKTNTEKPVYAALCWKTRHRNFEQQHSVYRLLIRRQA